MFFPNVIFFDAVGTLFGVKGSVGQIYSVIAQKFDVVTDYEALDRAFIKKFKTAPKIAFPHAERSQITSLEYKWWYDIAKSTFTEVGAFEQFGKFEEDFDTYFSEMYKFFAMPDAWDIYDDVIPTLDYLRDRGIELGIISNFDSRIYTVLDSLDLHKFFASVTISTEVGAAKPDSKIFQTAIAKHRSQGTNLTQNFWHIGDSFKEDYEGAENAHNNLKGIWLDRSGNSLISKNSISSFRDLSYLIELEHS